METSRFFSLDDSLWPFVLVQLRGSPTNKEYAEYLQGLTLLLERGEPHLVVLDMLQARFLAKEQAQQQGAWLKKNEVLLRERMLGIGFAVSSPFIRLGMSIVMHLNPPPAPYLIAPELRLVISWAARRLEEAGQGECAQQVREHHGYGACAVERWRLPSRE